MIRALVTQRTSERFWAKVEQQGECWIWTGHKVGAGYGHFNQGGEKRMMLAHRWAYEALVTEIPDGLVLDHLCMVKACVNERNPNSINKTCVVTHCPQCHEYNDENTRWYRGRRNCRPCARIHTANYLARKSAAA